MMKHLRPGMTFGLILILGIAVASAQSPALDPVNVAPHIFETVLENDRLPGYQGHRENRRNVSPAFASRSCAGLSQPVRMDAGHAGDGSRQAWSPIRLGDTVQWANAGITHGGEDQQSSSGLPAVWKSN